MVLDNIMVVLLWQNHDFIDNTVIIEYGRMVVFGHYNDAKTMVRAHSSRYYHDGIAMFFGTPINKMNSNFT